MTEDQIETCVSNLKRCVKSRKEHGFWLCIRGEDSQPVFLVERKLSAVKKQARLLRKTAVNKKAVSGRILAGKEGPLFVTDGGLSERHMHKLFLRISKEAPKIRPLLKGMTVLTEDEYDAARSAGDSSAELHGNADKDVFSEIFSKRLRLVQGLVGALSTITGDAREPQKRLNKVENDAEDEKTATKELIAIASDVRDAMEAAIRNTLAASKAALQELPRRHPLVSTLVDDWKTLHGQIRGLPKDRATPWVHLADDTRRLQQRVAHVADLDFSNDSITEEVLWMELREGWVKAARTLDRQLDTVLRRLRDTPHTKAQLLGRKGLPHLISGHLDLEEALDAVVEGRVDLQAIDQAQAVVNASLDHRDWTVLSTNPYDIPIDPVPARDALERIRSAVNQQEN